MAHFSTISSVSRGRVQRISLHLGTAAAALALGISLAGCGVRFDTAPADLPDLDINQVARNAAASCAANSVTALRPYAAQTKAAQESLTDAEHRLQAFGGVWNPWPKGQPAGTMNPPAQPEPGKSKPEILQYLSNCNEQARINATVVTDPHLAALLLSTTLAQRSELRDLAKQWTLPVPAGHAEAARPLIVKTGKYVPGPVESATELARARKQGLGQEAEEALVALDQARSDLEYVGARDKDIPQQHLLQVTSGLAVTINAATAAGYQISQPRIYAPNRELSVNDLYVDALKRATQALMTLSALPTLQETVTPALELVFAQRQQSGIPLGALPGIELSFAQGTKQAK